MTRLRVDRLSSLRARQIRLQTVAIGIWYRAAISSPLRPWMAKLKARHHISDSQLEGICYQVCYHEMTSNNAVDKFCQPGR